MGLSEQTGDTLRLSEFLLDTGRLSEDTGDTGRLSKDTGMPKFLNEERKTYSGRVNADNL